MPSTLSIALIGDHSDKVPAHRAIPIALALASTACERELRVEWVPTERVDTVDRFDGVWCVPASPYRSMEGALRAIRGARERGIPFLGTCGGFQHAVVEYSRNVLHWDDAEHAETAPAAQRPVITELECALVEVADALSLRAGSRIAKAYGSLRATEAYSCRYGLNPRFEREIVRGPLQATACDSGGEVRALELDDHPFFVATLFQPERAALEHRPAPVVTAFVSAAAAYAPA